MAPVKIVDSGCQLTNKAEEMEAVIGWLREHSDVQFVVIDHWDADQNAIGMASPDDPRRLVYIAWYQEPERYFVELETSPSNDSDIPYETIGTFSSVNREELAAIVKEHLR